MRSDARKRAADHTPHPDTAREVIAREIAETELANLRDAIEALAERYDRALMTPSGRTYWQVADDLRAVLNGARP